MSKLLGFIGMLVGGYIGFLNRPAALLGKLSFEKIMFAGANLKGVDRLFVSVARTSFNYMLIGAAIGLLAGIMIGSVFSKSKR